MIINEAPYSRKIVGRKIDKNTFELVELFDVSHPKCPIVLIGATVELLDEPTNQQSEELKVIE